MGTARLQAGPTRLWPQRERQTSCASQEYIHTYVLKLYVYIHTPYREK